MSSWKRLHNLYESIKITLYIASAYHFADFIAHLNWAGIAVSLILMILCLISIGGDV